VNRKHSGITGEHRIQQLVDNTEDSTTKLARDPATPRPREQPRRVDHHSLGAETERTAGDVIVPIQNVSVSTCPPAAWLSHDARSGG
jgi:hypothetical protein